MTADTVDIKPQTVSTELFPEVCYARRDRDGPAVDRRPPLPPPRRPSAAARPATDKSSPPPPPASAATASIEDVIGRLRLDDARKVSPSTVDGGVRRVPRMGTRLRSDVASSRSTAVSDPAPPAPADTPSTRLRPPDLSLDDDGRLSPLSREDVAVATCPMMPVDAVSCVEPVDRLPGVSRSTQTNSDGPPSAELEAYRVCADVMYTNRANLRHTIAVQQRLFRQQLADRQATMPRSADDRKPDTDVGVTKPTTKMEWIVRKRSDGSRYVTRRPVRSRSESVRRSAALVGDATTTDDDEVEQPKTGRYWTRDQRRQHVAERRQREAIKRATASSSSSGRPQHALAEELAAIGRHRQTPLLSVATV